MLSQSWYDCQREKHSVFDITDLDGFCSMACHLNLEEHKGQKQRGNGSHCEAVKNKI